jgi:tetratricopeptide (TPR) repeat protein
MIGFLLVFTLMAGSNVTAAEGLAINDDGRQLIRQATQAFDDDLRDQPQVTDPAMTGFVTAIAGKLLSAGTALPSGVSLQVSVIDSPKPMVYSYVDGHLVVSSGLVLGLENEAQLAGVLASQMAHLAEGYYLALYQQIKAAERRSGYSAVAGAVFGVLLDSAVDYTVQSQSIDMTEDIISGEATYSETMKRLAAMEVAQGAYYGIKDVVTNMPTRDDQGRAIDPRLQFEPVADAQGMIRCAAAGYDPIQCARGWTHIQRINNRLLKQERQSMGAFYEQIQAQQRLLDQHMQNLRQQLGDSGLVHTPSYIQPSKAQFVTGLTRMKEVAAATAGKTPHVGRQDYLAFVSAYLLPRAQAALEDERYEDAHDAFDQLYALGIRTAPVAYGLAKSELGDFAFGASSAELKRAEKAYREAARLDPAFAAPYRGLAELYSDTDDYQAAADAWRTYLKLAPDTDDRAKITRKIKTLERKAKR